MGKKEREKETKKKRYTGEKNARALNNVSCWAQSQHAQTYEWVACLLAYMHNVYILYVYICMPFTFKIVAATAISLRTSYAECVARIHGMYIHFEFMCVCVCVCVNLYKIHIYESILPVPIYIYNYRESTNYGRLTCLYFYFLHFFFALHLFGSWRRLSSIVW